MRVNGVSTGGGQWHLYEVTLVRGVRVPTIKEEEDTCVSYEEEDTCVPTIKDAHSKPYLTTRTPLQSAVNNISRLLVRP